MNKNEPALSPHPTFSQLLQFFGGDRGITKQNSERPLDGLCAKCGYEVNWVLHPGYGSMDSVSSYHPKLNHFLAMKLPKKILGVLRRALNMPA
jgi:hypothetical protein